MLANARHAGYQTYEIAVPTMQWKSAIRSEALCSRTTTTDLFLLEGHIFLAYADIQYSGWLEFDRLSTNVWFESAVSCPLGEGWTHQHPTLSQPHGISLQPIYPLSELSLPHLCPLFLSRRRSHCLPLFCIVFLFLLQNHKGCPKTSWIHELLRSQHFHVDDVITKCRGELETTTSLDLSQNNVYRNKILVVLGGDGDISYFITIVIFESNQETKTVHFLL